jgi:UDP-N-acetylglucosamine 2-epimerase (non-hydrolysing)
MKIILVAGARPNFMKIAPIVRALKKGDNLEWLIVHTGQHYDYEMSQSFFKDLDIPEPDYFLEAGSGSHATQTAKIMIGFEDVCLKEKPNIVVVVGDVNSTLACSVVAKKMSIQVAHVEAGLRSYDMAMPEEINRMVTDAISDYFFVTEKSGESNLIKEGKDLKNIYYVGHVMIDNLLYQLDKLNNEDSNFSVSSLKKKFLNYGFLTLHRPSNVDEKSILNNIVEALNEIAKEIPLIFPVHPRTKKMVDNFGIQFSKNIYLLPPLSFRESLYLWKDADFVLTDSGGLQEETTALGIPCFTIRENTERPITVEIGTNIVVGCKKEKILSSFLNFRNGQIKKGKIPELWDGKAAERIVNCLITNQTKHKTS